MGFLRKYRDPIVVFLLILLPLGFFISNSKDARDHNVLDRVVVTVSAPIQWLVVATLDSVFGRWNRYVALVGVEEDNEQLRDENARLRAEIAQREEERLENQRLRLLLRLKDVSADTRMLSARIIATSPTPLFRSVRIDRGRDAGLMVGNPVINHDGLVGRVVALSDRWADVMLLVDANASADVLVQRTRARARVRGLGEDTDFGIEVQHLARTADVEPGDAMLTSGVGGVFPKGLRVGTVTSVERGAFGLYQAASVEPSVDFSRLEEVMALVTWSDADSFEDTPNEGEGADTDPPVAVGAPPPAVAPLSASEASP